MGESESSDGSDGSSSKEEVIKMLTKLSKNVRDNTHSLQSLKKTQQSMSATITPRSDTYVISKVRSDRVMVEVKVSVLRIIDIDILEQNYAAEIFLQAKWPEPTLKSVPHEKFEHLDLDKYWDPLLVLTNMEGRPLEDEEWKEVSSNEFGYACPVIYKKRRMTAKFAEMFDMRTFPLDTHSLTLKVASKRQSSELALVEDRYDICEILSDAVSDFQEWSLFEHASLIEPQLSRLRDQTCFNPHQRNPRVEVICHVRRKASLFMWSIFIMLLIVGLSFSVYAFTKSDTFERLLVTFLMFLIAIGFRIHMQRIMACISHLTCLDAYFTACLLTIALNAVEACVVQELNLDKDQEKFEIIFASVNAGLHLLIFGIVLIWIIRKVSPIWSDINEIKKVYKKKQHIAGRYIRSHEVNKQDRKLHGPYSSLDQKSETIRSRAHSEIPTITRTLPPPTMEGVVEMATDVPPEKIMVPLNAPRSPSSRVPRRKSKKKNLAPVREDA